MVIVAVAFVFDGDAANGSSVRTSVFVGTAGAPGIAGVAGMAGMGGIAETASLAVSTQSAPLPSRARSFLGAVCISWATVGALLRPVGFLLRAIFRGLARIVPALSDLSVLTVILW